MLTISDLDVQLRDKQLLKNIDLTLDAGNILGLVGPSGCGKTTLLNTIAGFIEQTNGQIVLDEELVASHDYIAPAEDRQIGMIFQDYALFPHLTVEQNVAFGIANLTKNEQAARVDRLLTLLKLTELEQRYPHQLSGGQQQRVAIARALAPQPKLLLLDEPFSNIDARLRNELMLELRSLLKQLEMTAIFVTHNKDEVFTFADRIAVMHYGDILQSGTPAHVFQQPASWQVADFLQIGSWLPVQQQASKWQSALGPLSEFSSERLENNKVDEQYYLLVKPKYVEIAAEQPANVVVHHVSITEQGFHYLLASLSDEPRLSFQQLSYYSDVCYQQGQELSLNIIAHDYQIFSR